MSNPRTNRQSMVAGGDLGAPTCVFLCTYSRTDARVQAVGEMSNVAALTVPVKSVCQYLSGHTNW